MHPDTAGQTSLGKLDGKSDQLSPPISSGRLEANDVSFLHFDCGLIVQKMGTETNVIKINRNLNQIWGNCNQIRPYCNQIVASMGISSKMADHIPNFIDIPLFVTRSMKNGPLAVSCVIPQIDASKSKKCQITIGNG